MRRDGGLVLRPKRYTYLPMRTPVAYVARCLALLGDVRRALSCAHTSDERHYLYTMAEIVRTDLTLILT